MKRKLSVILAIVAVMGWAAAAGATPVDFKGSGLGADGSALSAEAIFDYSGTTLTVTLANTSTQGYGHAGQPAQLVAADVLTGLFWSGPAVSSDNNRINASATVSTGSLLVNSSISKVSGLGGTNVNSGWGYDTFSYLGATQGVGAAGFSGAVNFGRQSLGVSGNGTDLDGLAYGILPASYVTTTGPFVLNQTFSHLAANTGVTGKNPMEWDSVTFTFTGLTNFVIPQDVTFQYGSALTENHFRAVPIPPTALLLGSGLIGLVLVRRGSRKQS